MQTEQDDAQHTAAEISGLAIDNSLPPRGGDQRGFTDAVGESDVDNPRLRCTNVNVSYGDNHAVKNVSLGIAGNQVIALIGRSGCGKSSFLRCLNRMNDTIDICRVSGQISLDGQDICDRSLDVVQLHARVGMLFQKPNPFPKSIYDNLAYGPRIHGLVRSIEETD
jgi:phosphate transport system ATP-binding protein